MQFVNSANHIIRVAYARLNNLEFCLCFFSIYQSIYTYGIFGSEKKRKCDYFWASSIDNENGVVNTHPFKAPIDTYEEFDGNGIIYSHVVNVKGSIFFFTFKKTSFFFLFKHRRTKKMNVNEFIKEKVYVRTECYQLGNEVVCKCFMLTGFAIYRIIFDYFCGMFIRKHSLLFVSNDNTFTLVSLLLM
ncbi:hypothetical protein RFI_04437 [Reticulomyxa filosa]|uniref:Uncharacterized protein n=1 Tax=Reticulomyxa filosa TaxID=46433 RepID=X6P3L5_RETFI|nr:hypothetical protein RFI_04437 [Reticulomyxa filosa]|eukprot:ETO32679.1 hypothetical protein RFI_04437 [Reticulomyxa filosa]